MTTFGESSYIRIITNILNDDGGIKQSSDFIIAINGNNPSPRTFTGGISPGIIAEMDEGSYQVNIPIPDPGYDTTYSVGCSGSLVLGEGRSCVITNDDKANTIVPNERSIS